MIKNITKKSLIITAVSLLVVAGFGVWYTRQNNQSSDANDTQTTPAAETNDAKPPTEEEQKSGDRKKEEIVKENENTPATQPSNNTQNATVIITGVDQSSNTIQIRSFVPNVLRDGTCTFKLTKGSTTITKQMPAYADASATVCTNPQISRSEFSSGGSWNLVITFESGNIKGQSETKAVVIE